MTDERPLFQHPPWMVGVMLILGALSLFIGLTVDPFWLVIGSPAILTLFVYIGVRIVLSFRIRQRMGDDWPVESGEQRLEAGPEPRTSDVEPTSDRES